VGYELNHAGIISICPPDFRPNHADNMLEVALSKWGLWEIINEWLHDSAEFDESDVWVLSWDMYVDWDDVIAEFNDDDPEFDTHYDLGEILDWVRESVAGDSNWLGDPDPKKDIADPENVTRIALEITQELTRATYTRLGTDVLNPVLQPFKVWRCSLYGGRYRTG